jgi:hypothetical protein
VTEKRFVEGGQFCPQPAFSRLWPPKKAAAARIGRPPKTKLIHYRLSLTAAPDRSAAVEADTQLKSGGVTLKDKVLVLS